MSASELPMPSVISDHLPPGKTLADEWVQISTQALSKVGTSETDGFCGSSLTPGTRGDVKGLRMFYPLTSHVTWRSVAAYCEKDT